MSIELTVIHVAHGEIDRSYFNFQLHFNLRIIVDNPEEFEKLKAGQIGNIMDEVFVQQGAHPDPLSQVLFFTKATLGIVRFMDDELNQIAIWPRLDIAKAYFKTRTSVATIPADFKEYEIYFQNGQSATKDDAKRIAQFNLTAHLYVHDDNNVAEYLLENIDALAKMKGLHTLRLNVQQHNFRRINVRPFLEKVPSRIFFNYIAFNVNELSSDDIIEFMRMQDLPDGYHDWTFKGWVFFKKNSTSWLEKKMS